VGSECNFCGREWSTGNGIKRYAFAREIFINAIQKKKEKKKKW
jgi:hypothetical protein